MNSKVLECLARTAKSLYAASDDIAFFASSVDSVSNYYRISALADEVNRLAERLRVLIRMEELKIS